MVRRFLLLSLLVAIIVAWLGCGKGESKAPEKESENVAKSEAFLNNLGLEFVLVKGGTFEMGDTFGDGSDDEKPVHSVTLSDFYMSKCEVTFVQYDAFCEATDRKKPDDKGLGRGKRPVINVSCHDAHAFCDWVSKETGYEVRLPTEAEWEYAARGGSKSKGFRYSGSNDVDEVAWRYENSDGKIHITGEKRPNELGLYDMSGNVYEWCSDWYGKEYYGNSPASNPKGPSSGDYHVFRGGGWYFRGNYPDMCCASRSYGSPGVTSKDLGFRCARSF